MVKGNLYFPFSGSVALRKSFMIPSTKRSHKVFFIVFYNRYFKQDRYLMKLTKNLIIIVISLWTNTQLKNYMRTSALI